jgi:hypothetical protein
VSTADPRTVLDEAEELARQGRYPEALEKHVWFHEHALEYDDALSGVRVSFALHDWVELGKLYPPARQTLVAIRDRDAQALRTGSWSPNLFSDVAAINDYLGEPGETAALFVTLHRDNPGLARECYTWAEESLAAAREYGVCAAYIPDPLARFAEIRRHRRFRLADADLLGEADTAWMLEMAEGHFAEEVGRLVAILAGVGRAAEAQRVRELALTESPGEAVRAALGPGPQDSQAPA